VSTPTVAVATLVALAYLMLARSHCSWRSLSVSLGRPFLWLRLPALRGLLRRQLSIPTRGAARCEGRGYFTT
jgi:hypothetical protein